MELKTGTLLQGGSIRIERKLGQGGFGITYLAIMKIESKQMLGKIQTTVPVAVKEFFMKDYCNRESDTGNVTIGTEGSKKLVQRYREKFIKEARTIAELEHPNVVDIYTVFEENGTAYYVMKHINGRSLKELVEREGALSEEQALQYIRQVGAALEYIHRHKILHLDVKPANILLDDDNAVLIDFGISKRYDDDGSQTSSTPVGISKGYAPMEQYQLSGVARFSPCTDVYSLAATLYFLLTAKQPPEASIVSEDGLPPLPSSISMQTARAIQETMEAKRKDRPQSVEAFLQLLNTDETAILEEVASEEETALFPNEDTQTLSKPDNDEVTIIESATEIAHKKTNSIKERISNLWGNPQERHRLTNISLGAMAASGIMLFLYFVIKSIYEKGYYYYTGNIPIVAYGLGGLYLLLKKKKIGFWIIAASIAVGMLCFYTRYGYDHGIIITVVTICLPILFLKTLQLKPSPLKPSYWEQSENTNKFMVRVFELPKRNLFTNIALLLSVACGVIIFSTLFMGFGYEGWFIVPFLLLNIYALWGIYLLIKWQKTGFWMLTTGIGAAISYFELIELEGLGLYVFLLVVGLIALSLLDGGLRLKKKGEKQSCWQQLQQSTSGFLNTKRHKIFAIVINLFMLPLPIMLDYYHKYNQVEEQVWEQIDTSKETTPKEEEKIIIIE